MRKIFQFQKIIGEYLKCIYIELIYMYLLYKILQYDMWHTDI